MIVEMDFLKRALSNEERALSSASAAYNHYREKGDAEMIEGFKTIMEDEKEHVRVIKEMIQKKEAKK